MSASSRLCPSCGASNPDAARFCVACGEGLGRACERCGGDVPAGARFCPTCGHRASEGVPEGKERKLVTVLFADVVGSTSLGEALDPERFKEVMDAYFAAMRREIEAEGGTVEKFIGDAVMAVFGVPSAHEDDPTRALRAGLRMRHALARLNEDLSHAHGVTLSMRVGVNTGEVVAVSAPRAGEGLVTGDAVNVASRLEHAADTGQILVGERTARAARRLELRPLGPRSLKGKDEPVHVFELLEPDAGSGTMTRTAAAGAAPLVGREREGTLLYSVFDRVMQERRPHLVTVYGEAGVGKSRLVEEFCDRAAASSEEPPRVVVGRCLPYGEGITYWPLAEILKSSAGILDTDAFEVATEKIRATAGHLLHGLQGQDSERTLASLALSVGLAEPRSDAGLPRGVKNEIHAAWRAYLTALGSERGAVVVLEDLHWADPAMLDLVEDVAERVRGPVLFVCAARPELTARRPDWGGGRWNYSALLIDPLGDPDAERLLEHLLAEEDLPADVRARVLERAGGNPFFLQEITRHLLDQRRVTREEEGWFAGSAIEDVDIPDTVQGVLAARMDLLEPVEKRSLQSAAVVGRVFWSGLVERLLPPGNERILARLEERGLVMARLASTMYGEREYTFNHILTRDVAYDSLPRRDRARAHDVVASWIEERAGERAREFAELLAHHATEAHDLVREDPRADPEGVEALRERAFRHSLLASEEARRRLALSHAERHAEAALAVAGGLLERSRALEALGLAYFHDSEGDLAWQSLKEAVDLRMRARDEGQPVDGAELASLFAETLEVPTRGRGTMRKRLSEADLRPYLDLGLANVPEDAGEARVRLDIVQAHWPGSFREALLTDEQALEARLAGERAYAAAMAMDRPDLASAALDGMAVYHLHVGQYAGMQEWIDRRLEIVKALTDPIEVGDAYALGAWHALYVGRYRRAFELADEGFRLTAPSSELMALYCLDWRAQARFRLGDWDGVLQDMRTAGDLLGERRETPPGFVSDHIAVAALIHQLRGEESAADRLLQVVAWLERVEERPSPTWAACTLLIRAGRGEFEEARGELGRAEDPHLRYGRSVLLEAWCDLVAEEGAWAEAPSLLERSRDWARSSGVLALPAYADRLEGRAALAAGDRGLAVELLRGAAGAFDELEAPWEAALTRLDLAEVLAGEGTDAATGMARDAATSALAVVDRLGAVRQSARTRELLARLG